MSLLLQLERLVSQKGSDGDFAMNFDLNGRILKQINGPDTLHYAYNPQSYQLNHVSGSTSRAPDRDMSMEGNFQWDADGRKRSEIREDYSGADSVPNVNEYTMIQGRSSIVGRVRPDSLSEWYVKGYVPPAEQYTGKEWDGTYEFYYFGARFLDPVLGMWVVPDPAGQFANPYGFGGDPGNYTDPDGEFVVAAMVVGAVIGAYMGGETG